MRFSESYSLQTACELRVHWADVAELEEAKKASEAAAAQQLLQQNQQLGANQSTPDYAVGLTAMNPPTPAPATPSYSPATPQHTVTTIIAIPRDAAAQAGVLPTAPGTPASDLAAQGQTLLVATTPVPTSTPSYAPLVTSTTLQVSVHHILTSALILSFCLFLCYGFRLGTVLGPETWDLGHLPVWIALTDSRFLSAHVKCLPCSVHPWTSLLCHLFTFGCCILLHIYPTGSWCRQSQQSFNTSTPPFLFFLLTLYMFQPLRAILRGGIQLDVSKDYSYYNGSAVRTQLDVCLYWYFDPWSLCTSHNHHLVIIFMPCTVSQCIASVCFRCRS
jgi:hypothetical protein